MFKYLRFSLFVLTIIGFVACDKDKDPELTETEKQITAVTTELEKLSDVSGFTEQFKEMDLSASQAESFTVFAVHNSGSLKSASETSSPINIKRHIVEGKYTKAQLTDGLELNALSGDKLTVNIKDETIYINGVELQGNAVTADNSIIFVVPSYFPATNPEPSETEKQIEVIASELEKMNDVGSFTEQFNETDLSSQAGSFTVFAVKDATEKAASLNIKRHIIEGKYTREQLTDGLELNALSGDKLTVRKIGALIYINGIELQGEGVAADNSIIYLIPSSLPDTEINMQTVTLVAMSCNPEWTPQNDIPYLPAAGATISIQLENGTNVEYLAGNDGQIAVLLPRGSHSYTASKGNENNITDEGYVIAGIFTSRADITTHAAQEDAKVGGLKFVDYNGDARINADDKTESVFLYVGEEDKTINVYMAPSDFTPVYEEEIVDIDEILAGIQTFFASVIRESYLIDAAITRQFDFQTPPYSSLQNFQINAENSAVKNLWDNSFSIVAKSNKILEAIDLVEMPVDEKAGKKAKAFFFRAYAYSVLLNYFGGVPLHTDSDINEFDDRASGEQTKDFIITDLNQVVATGYNSIKYQAIMLKSRIYANTDDFNALVVKDVINSGSYSLSANWGGDAISEGIDPMFPSVFSGMTKENLSYPIRYAETLLLAAEADLRTGNNASAIEYVNQFHMFQGQVPIQPGSSTDEIRTAIGELWKTELNKEGHQYAFLKRTNLFMEKLGPFGAQPYHMLLPIPLSVINENPSLSQNEGY